VEEVRREWVCDRRGYLGKLYKWKGGKLLDFALFQEEIMVQKNPIKLEKKNEKRSRSSRRRQISRLIESISGLMVFNRNSDIYRSRLIEGIRRFI